MCSLLSYNHKQADMAETKTDRMKVQRFSLEYGQWFTVHAILHDFMSNWDVENEQTKERKHIPYMVMKRFVPLWKLHSIEISFLLG